MIWSYQRVVVMWEAFNQHPCSSPWTRLQMQKSILPPTFQMFSHTIQYFLTSKLLQVQNINNKKHVFKKQNRWRCTNSSSEWLAECSWGAVRISEENNFFTFLHYKKISNCQVINWLPSRQTFDLLKVKARKVQINAWHIFEATLLHDSWGAFWPLVESFNFSNCHPSI